MDLLVLSVLATMVFATASSFGSKDKKIQTKKEKSEIVTPIQPKKEEVKQENSNVKQLIASFYSLKTILLNIKIKHHAFLVKMLLEGGEILEENKKEKETVILFSGKKIKMKEENEHLLNLELIS